MKNLCGKCNVCCVIYDINKKFLSWRDTDKAKGEVCDKYVNNRCAKYLTRPKPCKDFKCVWYGLVETGQICNEEWRPDKLGFVVRAKTKGSELQFIIDELEKGSLNFNKLTMDQDTFLKTIFDIKTDMKIVIFFKPFGHDKMYALKFTPDTK